MPLEVLQRFVFDKGAQELGDLFRLPKGRCEGHPPWSWPAAVAIVVASSRGWKRRIIEDAGRRPSNV